MQGIRPRNDAFELWCWRNLLRVPWTARRFNQSILQEISPGCSLEGLTLKLKLQYSCKEMTHLKRPWCWERLRAGGEGDDRGWDGWMASLTQWTWVWVNSGSWWWIGRPGMLWFVGSQRVGHDWATELNWCANKSISIKVVPMLTSTIRRRVLIYLITRDIKCALIHIFVLRFFCELYVHFLLLLNIYCRFNWYWFYFFVLSFISSFFS